jgi:hypothetical protein
MALLLPAFAPLQVNVGLDSAIDDDKEVTVGAPHALVVITYDPDKVMVSPGLTRMLPVMVFTRNWSTSLFCIAEMIAAGRLTGSEGLYVPTEPG